MYNNQKRTRRSTSDKLSTTSSRISTSSIEKIIDKLRMQKHRDSTRNNYYTVWKLFNKFFISLDRKPDKWGSRLALFVGYLIECKKQISTIKSYISAIRAVLKDNKIKLEEDQYLINSLTKACRLINGKQVRHRLPIQKPLLRIILKKVEEYYLKRNQPYLRIMYQCLLSTMYFGLFRVGELTKGKHTVLARNVNIASNKKKFLFVLPTSKTTYRDSKPQLIKISSTPINNVNHQKSESQLPCPYELLRKYRKIRSNYVHDDEQFFVFADNSPVTPTHIRKCLKKMLKLAKFNDRNYSVHSLRAGRSCDLLKLGVSVETIKKIGCW